VQAIESGCIDALARMASSSNAVEKEAAKSALETMLAGVSAAPVQQPKLGARAAAAAVSPAAGGAPFSESVERKAPRLQAGGGMTCGAVFPMLLLVAQNGNVDASGVVDGNEAEIDLAAVMHALAVATAQHAAQAEVLECVPPRPFASLVKRLSAWPAHCTCF
jgi:hypothetical protein